ncbi:MAG: transcriptional repressor, partial [Pseudomonadota bacterium]
MSDIDAIIKHVEVSFRAQGKQLTLQRKLVLQALVHADKALSAY